MSGQYVPGAGAMLVEVFKKSLLVEVPNL